MSSIDLNNENFSWMNAAMLLHEQTEENEWRCKGYGDCVVENEWYGSLEALLESSSMACPPSPITTSNNKMWDFDDMVDFHSMGLVKRPETPEASPRIDIGPKNESKSGVDGTNGKRIGSVKDFDNGEVGVGEIGSGDNKNEFKTEVTDNKGKKNGNNMPAKNLMAERRRRKKVNDRLYMLRSVVPKISKADRTSILGDAIEYLKELQQRINELHNELIQSPGNPCLTGSSQLHPFTHINSAFLCQDKEESLIAVPNPDAQPPTVEVKMQQGKFLKIHMFCSTKPGLLLSTMRVLDGLGLDIKQAVISCFNGFTLDVFQAEQGRNKNITCEEIKALLLHTAGYQTTS